MYSSQNNKRIVKNTLFLYFRMILIMSVTLFTSRILLRALGVVDYGLNNVIAGTVILFSFLNNSLAASTSRFITFEIGKNNINNIQRVFKTSLFIHGILAIIVVLLGESIGIWLLNEILSIPENRKLACHIVFQMVIFSALCTIVQVPFNSLIVSYERMSVYAYIGITDAIFRCLMAYAIMISYYDRLILLSMLQMVWILALTLFYIYYCRNKFFNIALLSFKYDRNYMKQMLSYTTWGLIGSSANILKNQGVNILINIFFGSVVNTANAIAYQVNNAVMNFTNNFTMAINPQIIKSYASGDNKAMINLVKRGGKFSFFLLLYLCLPIIFEAEYILTLWLNEYPNYTIAFTRLVLILTMIETFTYSIGCAIQATGTIKNYQLVISSITLLNFPLSYILFKFHFPPPTALSISIIISIITLISRLYFMKIQLGIQPIDYIKNVFIRCIVVALLAIPIPYLIYNNMEEGNIRLITIITIIFIVNTLLIITLGMDNNERKFILNRLKELRRIKNEKIF